LASFDLDDLRERGFGGFLPIGRLTRPESNELPVDGGVYVVVRVAEGAPRFLACSRGGWWKKKDPTVSLQRLEREWVDGTPTLYIGKAMSLRERVGELVRFADGEPVRHWGGRLLWQVEQCEDFLLGWRPAPGYGEHETRLIDEFFNVFGCLPFANLKRGNRRG
jgi:hypothetical protein